ncbi:hypothetical protein BGZ54_004074 [Gamsiella multidivaricata]|nr:hypothetical protein BGZ54_004074 [Gamsiella multidivaricata]
MSERTVLIPELAELIAIDLTPPDLAACVRVDRTWFSTFIPQLYRHICVFDFDFHSHENQTNRKSRFEKWLQFWFPKKLGGSQVYKYAHHIRTISTANVHSLQYLGDTCTNLTHATVEEFLSKRTECRACPFFDREIRYWEDYFRKTTLLWTVDIWEALIQRNPRLVYVSMDLYQIKDGLHRIAEALGNLDHLRETFLRWPQAKNAIQLFLDQCPSIHTFTICIEPHTRIIARTTAEDGQPTGIKHLRFPMPSYPHHTVIAYMIKRCPALERLSLPYLSIPLFSEVAAAIEASPCRTTLKRIDFSGDMGTSTFVLEPFERLLAASEQLSSISFADSRGDFFASKFLCYIGLRDRLTELSFTSIDLYKRCSPTLVFSALELCPNLRVFEMQKASIDVGQFLGLTWACRGSLKKLRITLSCTETQARLYKSDLELRTAKQSAVFDSLANLQQLEALVLDRLTWVGSSPEQWILRSFRIHLAGSTWLQLTRLEKLKMLRIWGIRYSIAARCRYV